MPFAFCSCWISKEISPMRVQTPAFCSCSCLAKVGVKTEFQSKCRCLKADLKYLAGAGAAMSGKNQLQEHEVFLDCDHSRVAVLHEPISMCRCSCFCLVECVNVRLGARIIFPHNLDRNNFFTSRGMTLR